MKTLDRNKFGTLLNTQDTSKFTGIPFDVLVDARKKDKLYGIYPSPPYIKKNGRKEEDIVYYKKEKLEEWMKKYLFKSQREWKNTFIGKDKTKCYFMR